MPSTGNARTLRLAAVFAIGVLVSALAALIVLNYNPLRSLATLKKVDEYPLYVMHRYGSYHFDEHLEHGLEAGDQMPAATRLAEPAWACTVFAALNAEGGLLLGRNFDWHNRPALLLFSHPPDGYHSVSMVDIAYLGFGTEAPSWADRLQLLRAPYWPFDGMNEHGLAIGMMAVPHGQGDRAPGQATISSLDAIRLVLDKARMVDEAVALLGAYHIDWAGGPALHYLVADATGDSAVVEFVDGEMSVLRSEESWQAATNFVLTGRTPQAARRLCWRYRTACQTLEEADGPLSQAEAMDLLTKTSQPNTMWSVVYDPSDGSISVAMGREYDDVHRFQLEMASR